MKVLMNKKIKRLFLSISFIMFLWSLLIQYNSYRHYHQFDKTLFILSIGTTISLIGVCFIYFYDQNKQLEVAVKQIEAYLRGNVEIRIDCNKEGELYKLFHSINILSTVLGSHVDNELKAKEFLKEMIATISHQLKTPLTALNIYTGLLQNEAAEVEAITEITDLIEQELDRMEILIQNLLKIAKLDAGTILFKKSWMKLSDIMRSVASSFEYRIKQEQKVFTLAGEDNIKIFGDQDWIIEAISNIVKNALDHTSAQDTIEIRWKQIANLVQLTIQDTGEGIAKEDIHYIFKRFYRSCYSKDKQGVGLGLSLSKVIIEAHEGTITVDSTLGHGTTFTISFLIPTKL